MPAGLDWSMGVPLLALNGSYLFDHQLGIAADHRCSCQRSRRGSGWPLSTCSPSGSVEIENNFKSKRCLRGDLQFS